VRVCVSLKLLSYCVYGIVYMVRCSKALFNLDIVDHLSVSVPAMASIPDEFSETAIPPL